MRQRVELPTGTLQVEVDRSSWPLPALCGFAGRNNPKRGFLFVSRVLGKHIACTPASMSRVHQELAQAIPAQLVADAVVIGMAETATGLGHGVYEACLQRGDCAAPALYLQSTRYPLDGARSLDFQEVHSHAAQQFLYLPQSHLLRERLLAARSVILVDDEISTGRTLANLVASLREVNPHIEHVVLVCLTDFSQGLAERNLAGVAGVRSVRTLALLHGSFEFSFAPNHKATPAAAAFAPMSCRRQHCDSAWSARLGLQGALEVPAALLRSCLQLCGSDNAAGPVLVLGTGEFMHASHVLARTLAQHGVDTLVQSSTRSPILSGADVRHCIDLPDPYEEGIANYVYNLRPTDYRHILVVHETPRNPALLELCRRLGAHAVSFADFQLHPAAPSPPNGATGDCA